MDLGQPLTSNPTPIPGVPPTVSGTVDWAFSLPVMGYPPDVFIKRGSAGQGATPSYQASQQAYQSDNDSNNQNSQQPPPPYPGASSPLPAYSQPMPYPGQNPISTVVDPASVGHQFVENNVLDKLRPRI